MQLNLGRKLALHRVLAIMAARKPDFVVGEEGNLYLRRWRLLPMNKLCNIYLHEFLRSDDDRALHDHPYANISWVLRGGYWEHRFHYYNLINRTTVPHWVPVGAIKARWAKTPHRLELDRDANAEWLIGLKSIAKYRADSANPITIFFVGPRLREWGFHCPKGWRHWKEFVSQRPGGNAIGKGCED